MIYNYKLRTFFHNNEGKGRVNLKKKLMILGGSQFILPVIKAAHEMGLYVITVDYLPNNIAHRYSDEYCNVSIIDKDAVLETAKRHEIDGIMSFACDPGVVTAAYVAEKMNLPSVGSYEAVSILQNKAKFREFLAKNGFNVPKAKMYTSIDEALDDIKSNPDTFTWPVIVKPTDSAGSKGVTRVDSPDDLPESIENALSFSHCGEFIIEDYLQQVGFSSDTDSFSVDGELKFVSFACQRFDSNAKNPYTPSAYSWPSSMTDDHLKELTSEIQRLIKLLNLGTSIYNIETRECVDGKAYIMECSPRGGGNRLAEMVRFGTGVDLIRNSIRAAIGEECTGIEQKEFDGFWSIVILHSTSAGIYDGLWISDEIENYVVEKDLWIDIGTHVGGFSAANEAIGSLVLKFDDRDTMEKVMASVSEYVNVIVNNT